MNFRIMIMCVMILWSSVSIFSQVVSVVVIENSEALPEKALTNSNFFLSGAMNGFFDAGFIVTSDIITRKTKAEFDDVNYNIEIAKQGRISIIVLLFIDYSLFIESNGLYKPTIITYRVIQVKDKKVLSSGVIDCEKDILITKEKQTDKSTEMGLFVSNFVLELLRNGGKK